MICTIHQPNYLPYLGFFEKASRSNIFILYDSTQFKKNDWQNRNKVCTKNGWQWISVPILHDFGQKILETKIDPQKKGLKSNWQTIRTLYGKAPYFKKYGERFEEIYKRDYEYIADLNCDLIYLIADILGIKTKFVRNTSLSPITSASTQALVDLCKIVDADTYISGAEGRNYIEKEKFDAEKIKIIFQKYSHPEYKQFNTDNFISYMSTIDLLFNHGEESLRILCSNQDY